MLPLLARNTPRIIKGLVVPAFFTFHQDFYLGKKCDKDNPLLTEYLQEIEQVDTLPLRKEITGDKRSNPIRLLLLKNKDFKERQTE